MLGPTLEFLVAPAKLGPARTLSHGAVQWASRAARANLPALADDSHSNLGWSHEHGALLSQFLDGEGQVGFSFASGALLWLQAGQVTQSQRVTELDDAELGEVCDSWLTGAGLERASQAEMPYQLKPVRYRDLQTEENLRALETLGAWFAATQRALESLISECGAGAVSAPAPRCWPHHFDLATLLALEEGDLAHARSVGIGLSPGDAVFDEPYLYCNPWPVPGELPAAPDGLFWHTEGFTSLVCPVSRLTSAEQLTPRTREAFDTVSASLK